MSALSVDIGGIVAVVVRGGGGGVVAVDVVTAVMVGIGNALSNIMGDDDSVDTMTSFFLRSLSCAARSDIHRNALLRPLDKLLFPFSITCCDEQC